MFGANLFTPVVKNIIIICGLMLIAQNVYEPVVHYFGALHPTTSDHFYVHQFITNVFLHADFDHLLFNMIGLLFFGSFLENALGQRRFLFLFLACGIGGSILHFFINEIKINQAIDAYNAFMSSPSLENFNIFIQDHSYLDRIANIPGNEKYIFKYNEFFAKFSIHPQEYMSDAIAYVNGLHPITLNTSTVGASGGVMGVIAATALLFPNMKVMLLLLPPIKMQYIAIGYIVMDLIGEFQSIDMIAHLGHIGGAIFAFLMIKVIWNIPKQY